MVRDIIKRKILGKGENKQDKNFFDLSSSVQKKIIDRAARDANRDQLELVRKYEKCCGRS